MRVRVNIFSDTLLTVDKWIEIDGEPHEEVIRMMERVFKAPATIHAVSIDERGSIIHYYGEPLDATEDPA